VDVTTIAFQYECYGLVPSMYFLVQNEQLEPVLIRMKCSLCHVTMQLNDSISASCVSRTKYYYWLTKHADDFCYTIPQVLNVDFAPNKRAVLDEENDFRRAF